MANEKLECMLYHGDVHSNRKKLIKNALSQAEKGKVLYILQEELNELPELSQDLNMMSRQYMKMISFVYAKSLEALLECVSTLPDWKNIPSLIILDGLERYCGDNDIQEACGVIAFLIDAGTSCSEILHAPIKLCVSINRDVVVEEYCKTIYELYFNKTLSSEVIDTKINV